MDEQYKPDEVWIGKNFNVIPISLMHKEHLRMALDSCVREFRNSKTDIEKARWQMKFDMLLREAQHRGEEKKTKMKILMVQNCCVCTGDPSASWICEEHRGPVIAWIKANLTEDQLEK
jgi:hypothetical protein